MYLRDQGDTEVGGFGISPADDLLLIEDVRLMRQRCTPVTVEFDDTAVAEFFDEQIDAGRRPQQFARTWIHTHPGDSPLPSSTDEETFARVFGRADWAVMFILAKGGRSYARLGFHVGPGGSTRILVRIDYGLPFSGADPAAWDKEYQQCVQPVWNLDDWSAEFDLRDNPSTSADSELRPQTGGDRNGISTHKPHGEPSP